jgi:DNA polymerase-3 subunit delta
LKIEEIERLRAELAAGKTIPMVYVSGGDDGVIDSLVEMFTAYSLSAGSEVKVIRLDASGAKSDAWEQFNDIAQSFPMFDEKSIVVMTGCAGGTKVPKESKPCLETPPDHTIMVFSADRKTAASPLAKLVKEHGRVLDFKDLKDAQARAMAVSGAREMGIQLDQQAADALVDMVGTDIGAIDSALRSLAGLVPPGGGQVRVAAADLAGLVRRTKRHAPWDLDEAIERRDLPRAVKVAIRELQDSKDPRGRAIGLYNTILRRVRAILIAADLVADRIPQDEAMERLGINWPFMYERVVQATRNYSRHELEQFLKDAMTMEIRMKAGAAGPETRIVEILNSLMVRR